MLLTLNIKNFTLVDSLEVDFSTGMTAITGETGAGKSLTLDALSMALGDRADSDRIRHGTDRAEIAASFDVSKIDEARQWLAAHDFEISDSGECLLRRLFNREGRSRGYINGQPATMQQLQRCGDLLIDIHSQHEHQSLLRRDTHRKILDGFGGHSALCRQTEFSYKQWRERQNKLEQLSTRSSELDARRQLLNFQVAELNDLALDDGELASLEAQQLLLANADSILLDSQALAAVCSDDENFNLLSGFSQASSLLGRMASKNPKIVEIEALLDSARIQTEEAAATLRYHIDTFELNPQKLAEIEDRLSMIYQLARKHRIQPGELIELHAALQAELTQLAEGGQNLEILTTQVRELHTAYQKSAQKLSRARSSKAAKLSKAVSSHFADLAMAGADLKIELQPYSADKATAQGLEQIEFLIRTNSGQPHKSLIRVASGGELSRISLAIQVVTAQTSAIPTLVFDEVDVGIGGATAEVVGRLLRQLGQCGQVICVTHLPQVASCAHQQLQVEKASHGADTHTELNLLSVESRIEEIARMLGGMKITAQTLTHAKEMLAMASDEHAPHQPK